MRRSKTEVSAPRTKEADVQIEPISTAEAGIPGMHAAMGFATDFFATWMIGLMTMPIELVPAIGCSTLQAINGAGSGSSTPSRR